MSNDTENKDIQADMNALEEGSASPEVFSGLDIIEEDVVDLDALFDALNIAAVDSPDAMEFVATEKGGILTIPDQALSVDPISGTIDDFDVQSGDLLKSIIVSDES
jgi:hypothetical protein